MIKVKNCAICHNSIILDFESQKKECVCPHCGNTFQYRLLGRSMYEVISDISPAGENDYQSVYCG
jgi:hypothetical protein